MASRANDNLPEDIRSAMDYLSTGGLGEVYGITDMAYRAGQPKVQCDADMMLAICMLASEALDARRAALSQESDNG
ncbi:hypothetical protein GCM10007989_07860 [Devosia pacifica]|uniref:Uncharacterized protein n=1 Tax=Devosia pacifica TaxID=1335967 RepID=A0A918VNL8_9HYPH|nr:hypothetical protein [Devosia pacifica]GHA15510.1 hypothetical protein GCM10007989_07860 [Devosia pacifica]